MARSVNERSRTATSQPAPTASDRMMSVYVLAGVILLIGIPTAVAVGASWVRFSDVVPSGRSAPNWVTSEAVRATTSDGDAVKAQVAIDARDQVSRSALEANRTEVALLLQISVGAHDRSTIQGADGMQRLSRDMQRRLDDFLRDHGAPPVQSVIVQDLLFSKV